MKKNHTTPKRILVAMAAMMLTVGSASAQGLLKGLAGKAAQKVTEKVVNKATKKVEEKIENSRVGQAVSAVKEVAQTKSEAEDHALTVSAEYPENLAPSSDDTEYWYFEIDEESIPTPSFSNYADVLKGWPALPTAAQMKDEAAMRQYCIDVKAFGKGLEQMAVNRSMKAAEAGVALRGMQQTTLSAESRAYTDKMMAAMMSLPEAEREKIAQFEDGDSAAMLAYMKENHPDIYKLLMSAPAELKNNKPADESRYDAYGEIADAVQPILDKTGTAVSNLDLSVAGLMNGGLNSLMGPLGEIQKLRKELIDGWMKSEECAKIKAMEEDLVKRVNEYDAAHPSYDVVYTYPPFWSEERAKQNEIIDAYNEKIAERWVSGFQKILEPGMADFKIVAEQDVRLESLGWNDDMEKMAYLSTSSIVNGAGMMLQMSCFNVPSLIFGVPFIEHASVQDYNQ